MNEPYIEYPCGTKTGFMPAYEGDGLVMERLHVARGTVQLQTSPTLCCTRGGGCGVVIKVSNTEVKWFNGAKPDGLETASIGDGLKLYPNPAREGSAGTVQKGMANALNCHHGGGSGTITSDLKIRYLTPRECLRLMGFKDPEIDKLMEAVPSKSNEYKLAGNSIVVDCLESIFKGIYIDKTFRNAKPRQISLSDFGKKQINPIVGWQAAELEKEMVKLEGNVP